MAPLSEIHNQARPLRRPAVYGRRKGINAETREMHRQLFGTDESDISNVFGKLTIDAELQTPSDAPAPTRPSPKQSPRREPSGAVQQHSAPSSDTPAPRNTPLYHLENAGLKTPIVAQRRPLRRTRGQRDSKPAVTGRKKAPARRKQPGRGTKSREMAPITPREEARLQPLLSMKLVQGTVQSFAEFNHDVHTKCSWECLGRGSYATTFTLNMNDDPTNLSVIKIIRFTLDEASNNNDYSITNVHGILREIQILDTLSPIPGFARACGWHRVVRGKYPPGLVKAFEAYKPDDLEETVQSLADDDEATFYAIIEMASAGTDCEQIKAPSSLVVYDIFWMVTSFLANAERQFNFEHRDLHISNLCYKPGKTRKPFKSDEPSAIFGRSGYSVNIIDYTLSRMVRGKNILYESAGPGESGMSKSQADTYQEMAMWRCRQLCNEEDARAMATDDSGVATVEKWSRYMPKTNVVWLVYLIRLLSKRGVEVKDAENEAEEMMQREVWGRLQAMVDALDVEDMDGMPGSAQDLLEVGYEKGWIAKDDVAAFVAFLNTEDQETPN